MRVFNFLKRKADNAPILSLYRRIMRQARAPVFYHTFVRDDFDGRFELLIMHIYLVERALRYAGRAHDIGQDLIDFFFADMDSALRETGVGDMSIGKKIRKMAEAFYGRAAALDAIFKAKDEKQDKIKQIMLIVQRNLDPEKTRFSKQETLFYKRYATYIIAADAYLSSQTPNTLLDETHILFPSAEDYINE